MDPLKMHFLLEMVIFHYYARLPEGSSKCKTFFSSAKINTNFPFSILSVNNQDSSMPCTVPRTPRLSACTTAWSPWRSEPPTAPSAEKTTSKSKLGALMAATPIIKHKQSPRAAKRLGGEKMLGFKLWGCFFQREGIEIWTKICAKTTESLKGQVANWHEFPMSCSSNRWGAQLQIHLKHRWYPAQGPEPAQFQLVACHVAFPRKLKENVLGQKEDL